MDTTTETNGIEKHGFEAEVGRLLDLVVHSLYSEREIFLRELVANAADAVDRRRFESLTHPALVVPEGAKLRISPDKAARTITISDEGMGMSREELIAHLGTIARSGSRAFTETLASAKPEERPSLIGQFGVGFYSSFMVAERVEFVSRKAGTEETWIWASAGRGEFTIAPGSREIAGSDVILHIKADAEEFLEPMRLETIVRKWADHITLPITIVRDGKDEAANEGTALWRKSKSEVEEAAYTDFYRHLGHNFDAPWATLHWRAEGVLEFHALLFIPSMKPFMPVEDERVSKLRLHVRRMFITDAAELLPAWLRFVQGVVDTEDLPLNVSREMLQSTPVLARIRRAVTNRAITELKNKAKEAEDYAKFWENFGPILKEGAWDDADHRKDVASLMRFRSTGAEGWVSFAEYVERMKPEQEAIYYLVGDDAGAMARSAQIEGFRARGIEVLLLADSIDAFWPERLDNFEEKKLRSVSQSAADLAKFEAETPDGEVADTEALVASMKETLGDEVSAVRATERLVDSAAVLAAGDGGPDLQMQRLMRRSGRTSYAPAPVLEINPRHGLIATLAGRLAKGDDIAADVRMLFDLARIQDGDLPKDTAEFARRVEQAMRQG
ncbi:MAG: molecular chaperone HtpG [Alphaproteobacteria bacterium]|nr:molecular chaperone HtpG [Alphaproteobacteria bacterium]